MKCRYILFLLVIAFASGSISQKAEAQTWKHLKHKVKKVAKKHTGKHINKVTTSSSNAKSSAPADAAATIAGTSTSVNIAAYKNYDFVPGKSIVFETDFTKQQNAELPARLGILNGTAEIQIYKGEKVLHLEKGTDVCFIPMLDSTNYLPDQFTVEFDFMYNDPNPRAYNQIEVDFYKPDRDNNYMKANYGDYHFHIYEAYLIAFGSRIQNKELSKDLVKSLQTPNIWHHIAIYVHNNIGKAYIDQYRVGAANMMQKGATKLAIKTNGRMEYMIKNLRIAGGGSDAYHKIMTDGKLVTHGIHFTSGKADLLPESMGTINEVYQIMKNHPDLKFEIDGYTDNVGAADFNLKLSKQRADAVQKQLVNMGVDTSRLMTKGFGETKPLGSNATPEGKANNRRVEFVKM
jgi:outer membrane protein OmpA-like peptidoglycan-associated protein